MKLNYSNFHKTIIFYHLNLKKTFTRIFFFKIHFWSQSILLVRKSNDYRKLTGIFSLTCQRNRTNWIEFCINRNCINYYNNSVQHMIYRLCMLKRRIWRWSVNHGHNPGCMYNVGLVFLLLRVRTSHSQTMNSQTCNFWATGFIEKPQAST